jgi:hypothetical protein
MKRALLLFIAGAIGVVAGVIAVIAGVITLIRNVPDGLRERVTHLPGAMIGRMMEHMPDE